jgi:hypothetical protein
MCNTCGSTRAPPGVRLLDWASLRFVLVHCEVKQLQHATLQVLCFVRFRREAFLLQPASMLLHPVVAVLGESGLMRLLVRLLEAEAVSPEVATVKDEPSQGQRQHINPSTMHTQIAG